MAEAQPATIGFDPEFEYRGLEDFKGLNTKARRPSIDDEECSWLENLMPIGKGNMRSMYGEGPTLYTAPGGRTIVYGNAYNIGTTDYLFICLDNGTVVQVRVSDGAQTTISSTVGRFYNGGDLPHITQWGNSGILIVTTAVADGYFAWDGTLYLPGGVSPPWLSGLAAPVVLAGASNSNATLTGFASTVGVVVGMQVAGSAGDIPANTFVNGGTSSTVTITNAATGSNSENFTFSWPMPTGIQGVAVDTYQGRVFIVNGTQRLMSAAGNGTYFAAANGGNIAVSSDSNLRKHYTHVISANGYVYFFGDSSIFNGSNVTQTVANGVSTAAYQYTNSDPQTGTEWANSVQVFGRAIVFANPNGVYDLLGNSATKISDQLDGIFSTLDTSVKPTAAVATVFSIRILIVCLRAKDYLGNTRNMLCLFDGKKWWVASQVKAPNFIFTLEANSALVAYGIDGSHVYPLFQTPTSALMKILQSKLYGGQFSYLVEKLGERYYLQQETLSATSSPPVVTVDSETSSIPVQGSLIGQVVFTNALGQAIQFQNAGSQNLFWTLNGLVNAVQAPNSGNLLGFTYTNTTPDFVIERTGIGYKPQTALY